MKYKTLCVSLIACASLIGITSCETSATEEPQKVALNELSPIEASKTTLHAKEEIKLSCASENITWSVSNDLATIDQDGNLKAGDTDGQFVVTVTSKDDSSFTSNKLFTIKTMSSKELADMIYNAALGQNYTMTWTGKFLNEDGTEVTKEQVEKDDSDITTSLIFEDMAIKGNVAKYTKDAFYCLYGVDGAGNEYEGGSYNSPDGFVHDYDVTDGVAIKGQVDYYSYMLGVPTYEDIYTGDLRYFVRDEFKVEDANLTLSEDCSHLVYDATKDKNDFRDMTMYDSDFSFATTLFGIVDSFYGLQFSDYGWDLDAKGEVIYDENSMTATFHYVDIPIGYTAIYDYEATITLKDIGTTVIDGIDALIAADKAELEAGEERSL